MGRDDADPLQRGVHTLLHLTREQRLPTTTAAQVLRYPVLRLHSGATQSTIGTLASRRGIEIAAAERHEWRKRIRAARAVLP